VSEQTVFPALLSQSPDNQLRDTIRAFVRDELGPDYIVDPDMLTQSDILIATDRGRAMAMAQPILLPDVSFRLEKIESSTLSTCRLVLDHSNDVPKDTPYDAVLVLPDAKDCMLIPPATP
jgi:hypothetical protein